MFFFPIHTGLDEHSLLLDWKNTVTGTSTAEKVHMLFARKDRERFGPLPKRYFRFLLQVLGRRTIMCKKLLMLTSFMLVLGLVGPASAQLPEGWTSQDINTEGGSAEVIDGTWTVSGDGADVWGSIDEFQYVYTEMTGDVDVIARVVSNGTGSNTWAKGGVMIRETTALDSKHMIMALTGSDGGGIAFQGRPVTGDRSNSFHGDITAAPPHWVRLTREGNTITAYHSCLLYTSPSPRD